MLNDYYQKTKRKPLIWLRFIDDIFFIWPHGHETLNDFLDFAQNYSSSKRMKSKIKFEIHQSTESVNFLDVNITLTNGRLSTSLYSKPTDSHLYLDNSSCHPEHVIKNIPKGQFLRLRRICSDTTDFIRECNRYIAYFIARGYDKDKLYETSREVLRLDRNSLLTTNRNIDKKQHDQSIFITTWHPSLRFLHRILRKHFFHIQNDDSLKEIFPEVPMVAFRRKKSIRNYIVRNDINPPQKNTEPTMPCNNCKKTCHLINQSSVINNNKNGRRIKVSAGGNCKTTNIIYVARCKKHDLLYIGHTGDDLARRFSKHRYDNNNRPNNNELTKHLNSSKHNFERDLEISILKKDVPTLGLREYYEDKFICKLGTLQPNGLNVELNQYGKDMYASFQKLLR